MAAEQDRDNRGRFDISEPELEARRTEVIKLRVAGYGFRDIARQLGIGLATAYGDFKAVMDRTKSEADSTAEQERQVSLARLDKAIAVLMPLLDDSDSCLDAMDRLDKLEKRRAALLGLDAPARQELTGKDGAPVPIDARGSLIDRLAGLVAGAAAEGSTGKDSGSADGS